MSISKQKIERFISTQLIQWLNGKRNDKLLISKLVQTYSDWAKAGWSLSLYKFWIGDVEGLGVGYDVEKCPKVGGRCLIYDVD